MHSHVVVLSGLSADEMGKNRYGSVGVQPVHSWIEVEKNDGHERS